MTDVLSQLDRARLTALDLPDVRVKITHPDRVLWPATATEPPVTRRDLLRYFLETSGYLLPYLENRPLTLLRYPYGLQGKHFFQKHVEFEAPSFVDRECLISEHTGLDGTYLFCNNQATLLWLAQIANIELHTWYSRKTGLHVFVPILRQFDYDAVRGMSEQICRFVHRQHPRETTMEWSVEKRRGKIFLDHNQNTRGKTLAAPYSPRALPGAPVSMPVRWSELPDVYPSQFTLRTAHQRLSEVGDLWRDILDHKADLTRVFKGS